MLTIILAPIWFAYRAKRAGRNPVGWAFIGVVIFIILKIITTVIAVNATASSYEDATSLTIILNIFLLGGTFLAGLLIPRIEKATRATVVTNAVQVHSKDAKVESSELTETRSSPNTTVQPQHLEFTTAHRSQRRESYILCDNCGTEQREDRKLCLECGAKFKEIL